MATFVIVVVMVIGDVFPQEFCVFIDIQNFPVTQILIA